MDLNTLKLKLAGASFSVKDGEAYFIAINPDDEDNSVV